MNRKRLFKNTNASMWLRAIISMSLTAALFYAARPAYSCGPFFEVAYFYYSKHPDFPLSRFAAGELGVLQPTYARSYLVAAYRHMAGAGFSGEEQKALVSAWDERLGDLYQEDRGEWVKPWIDARSKVPGLAKGSDISPYRTINTNNFYSNFVNCPPDAFKTAGETLNRLIELFGPASAEVKGWVEAQDKVFANCSEGQLVPEEAPASLPAALRAHRSYQIASANFYATNFDASEKQFARIAADSSSPWRQVAPYMTARSLIRKATLVPEYNKIDTPVLARAETELKKIIGNSASTELHSSARGLLGFVNFRLHPEKTLRELAGLLLRKGAGESLRQAIIDYTLLLDKFVDDNQEEKAFNKLPAIGRQDDLTDWVLVFQVMDREATDYSLRKWEQTNSLPWLVAAISKVDGRHPRAAPLLAAADRIKPDSPARATLLFHIIRLMIEGGRTDQARARLMETLQGAPIPPSSRNIFMSLASMTALSLEEFLKYAQRQPVGISFDTDGRELPDQESSNKPEAKKARFDNDAAAVLNYSLPLAALKKAALSPALASHLRRDVTLAAWVRAVLLEDEASALALAPALESLVPELEPYLSRYSISRTGDAKRFMAVYLMLKMPGTRPVVDSGLGRVTEIGKIDDYRDNWWCAPAERERQSAGAPAFITAADRAKAAEEVKRLAALGPAPNYLAAQAVRWANANPNSDLAPEALHLAVRATRYGCRDERTGSFSKQAFDTLHRKYPRSEWAKKTPYWFKE
jgi:hypothetical protein